MLLDAPEESAYVMVPGRPVTGSGTKDMCRLTVSTCVDTVSRHISFVPDPVTGLPGTMTYADSSGASRSITFQYAPVALDYLYKDGNGNVCSDGGTAGPKSTYLLTKITLANNLHYDFQYFFNTDGTTTGEVTRITLPTSGYIRYVYGFGPISTDANLNSCGVLEGNAQNRMVINRIVSSDGSPSSERQWSYSLAQVDDSFISHIMTVTDPGGNAVVYSRAFGSPLPYQTDYKDGNGKILKSLRGEIESSPDTTKYFYSRANFQNARFKSSTTILSDTNQQSKTTF